MGRHCRIGFILYNPVLQMKSSGMVQIAALKGRKNALAEVSDTILVGIKYELNLTQTYKDNELVTDY